MADGEARHGIDPARIAEIRAREAERYRTARPRTERQIGQGAPGYFGGVPMHWMLDWPMPFPILVERARDTTITDVDGNALDDFCLGDTGSMFGHSPRPVARAIRRQAKRGLTYMLPSEDAIAVGQLLPEMFGLPLLAGRDDGERRQPLRAARRPGGNRPAENPGLQRLLSWRRRGHVRPAAGRSADQPSGAGGRIPRLRRNHPYRRVQRSRRARTRARPWRRRLRHHRAGADQQLHGAA